MSRNRKANKVMPKGTKAKKQNPKGKNRQEAVAVVQKGSVRVPRTMSVGTSTVVSHTETYGVNVTGSDPFSVFATWALQPGLKTYSRGSPLGQWLPEIAQNFDNYEIEQLRFKFRTACSTLTTGLAVFGFEPNPEGTAPTTYQEIRNMHSADGSVHANLSFDVTSKVKKRLLVRKGNVVNLPSYDAGKVYFATIGVSGNALVGFVDVEYRIRLYNPQASITSSELVPVNPGLPNPTQYLTWDAATMPELNVANDAMAPWNYFCQGAGAASGQNLGAPLVTIVTSTNDALDSSYAGGCQYKVPGGGGKTTLRVATTGRYRLSFSPRWDWLDLKMFAIAPFTTKWNLDSFVPSTYRAYGAVDGSTVVTLPVEHCTHRGFTGVATLDPNPGTDVWPTFRWDVDFDKLDEFSILVGRLSYNSVSTDAKVTGRTGLGLSTLRIEYLGPIVTA